MSDSSRAVAGSFFQQSIPDIRICPTNAFIEFGKEDIEQSISDRFEQQVAKYPDRTAVKTRNHTLTYDALNKMANRVARAILAQRGEGEEPVALLLDHDAPIIAAILGVLKAGKFYLPLDPAHPQSRLACLLEDSQAALIVTNNKHLSLTMELASKNCSSLNIDELGDPPTENLSLRISPDRLAYLRYTSGSTGQPKGVLEKHRNLLHVVMQETNAFHLCADDRLTFLGSWGKHIFRGLLTGASLFPANVKEEGLGYLAKWLAEEEITILFSTSTLFRHFVDTFTGEETFPALRLVRLAGEPVLKRDVELYKNHFSAQCILVNELASTDAGGITAYFIDKRTEITSDIMPVGYPLDDVKVLLLNDEGKKVRFDEIGEIAVQSRYLFPGYWRKPELTRAAFLTDSEGGDEQIFLTGDLGVMRPDGCFEHRGRKDFRVKIRGLRVELEEVEAVLRQHPVVREAVILARQDEPSDKRLVAYVVPRAGQTPRISEMRSFLKAKLPEYMVPSAFLMLEVLPLTPNGKVDRRALPAPDQGRPEVETTFVAPQDALELRLTKMWEKLLGIQSIGVQDNFFELGGHSLLAVQLIAQIEKVFGKTLPPAILFQAPTIEHLASILRQEKWPESWSSLVPIQPGGSKLPFFWVHGDSSDAFLPRYLGPDQPLYGLEHQSQDGKPALYTEVETIAAHYLKEIRTVQPEGPYFLGGYSFGGIVAFEMAQHLKRQGEEIPLLFLLDPPSPSNGNSSSALPSSPNGLTNITLFRDKAHRHLRNLTLLEPQEKSAYILVRAKEKIKDRTAQSSKILKKVICKVYVAIDRSLPPSLRSGYILDIYSRARRNYVPQLYRGMVVYIKSEKRSSDHQLKWGRLITGGLEIYEVPGDHMDVVKEPYANAWAKRLRFWLDTSQENRDR